METSTIVSHLLNELDIMNQDCIILAYISKRKDFNGFVKEILKDIWSDTGNPESIQDSTVQEFLEMFLKTDDVSFVLRHVRSAVRCNVHEVDEDEYYEKRVSWKLTTTEKSKTIKFDQVYTERGEYDEINCEMSMCPGYLVETRDCEYSDLQALLEEVL